MNVLTHTAYNSVLRRGRTCIHESYLATSSNLLFCIRLVIIVSRRCVDGKRNEKLLRLDFGSRDKRQFREWMRTGVLMLHASCFMQYSTAQYSTVPAQGVGGFGVWNVDVQ